MRARLVLAAVLLPLLAEPAQAHGVILVTHADDAGAGSLRQALLDADAGTEIEFQIEADGVQSIAPQTPLPPIATGVSIDGTTQQGASCASWPPTLLVELDGSSLAPGSDALVVAGDAVSIRGLVVNRAPRNGIVASSVSGFGLTCSIVGSDATGTLARANGAAGVLLDANNSTIGGPSALDRTLISGNAGAGIEITPLASGNAILGSYVGTTADGLSALPNFHGIVAMGPLNVIGGAGNAGNLISGNVDSGVRLDANSALQNQILGNRIGVDLAGGALDNGGAGVLLAAGASSNGIGAPGVGNELRNNGGGGVFVSGDTSLGNSIRGNAMAANGTIGIDLFGDFFADPNDPGDADPGPNRLQNTPELAAASYTAATQTIHATFSVDSDPANASYPLAIDFYRADIDDEEGEVYLGSAAYSAADFASGDVERSFAAQGPVMVGDRVLATATDAAGNSSEFSANPLALAVPEPGAAATALAAALALACRRPRRRR